MSEHTAWNRGFDAGWYAALQHVPGQVGETVPNPYPRIPEQPTTASVRCSNKEAHEPHWHVIRAEGITWAQGNCDGLKQDDKISRLSCRRCLAGDHTFCLGESVCPCALAGHPRD